MSAEPSLFRKLTPTAIAARSRAAFDRPVYRRPHAPVLDPIERVSEVIFGILMAMSFTGSISAATAGHAEIETMIWAAFGCNLAWGLVDGVMYVVGEITERHHMAAMQRRLRETEDTAAAHHLILPLMPDRSVDVMDFHTMETIRQHLLAMEPPAQHVTADDLIAAFTVFCLVVLATFPVVVPFLVIADPGLAIRWSNLLALVTLFVGGWILGKHAGGSPWIYGGALTATGAVLIAAIIALGG
jgi:VIT1/CCC1 family predicted Fe2+/Mn2+ transporter